MSVNTLNLLVANPKSDLALTNATVKAADLLGIKNVELAKVLGISDSQVSRISNGEKIISYGSKASELALILVRIYRSLDALVGNNDKNRLMWMESFNRAINDVPNKAIQNVEGLIKVVNYLDDMTLGHCFIND